MVLFENLLGKQDYISRQELKGMKKMEKILFCYGTVIQIQKSAVCVILF